MQIEKARLAAILDLAAALANLGLLVSRFGSRLPPDQTFQNNISVVNLGMECKPENAEGTGAYFAFRPQRVFCHSNVGVIAEAHLKYIMSTD